MTWVEQRDGRVRSARQSINLVQLDTAGESLGEES